MTETLNTPDEWQKSEGVLVLDPDGWDRTDFERSWSEPISRDEFMSRVMRSSCLFARKDRP